MTNTTAIYSNGKRPKRSWPPRGVPKRGSRKSKVTPANADRQANTVTIRRCGVVTGRRSDSLLVAMQCG